MEDSALPPPVISSGAGFWIRAGARIVDTLYGIALGFLSGLFAGIVLVILEKSGLIAPGWQSRLHGTNIAGWGCGLLGGFLYHSLTEGIYGASLGKLIFRLRVVTENGGPIGMKQALLRSLAYYFDALFFGVVAYTAMRDSDLNQRYGDRWAHTVVVESKNLPSDSRRGAEIFILAFLMGSVFWIVLNGLGLILHVM